MAIYITDECINCGSCEPECPNNAIYEGGVEWRFADGTELTGPVKMPDGTIIDAEEYQPPLSEEVFYIVSYKCTECVGFHEEPQCAAVCPVDCCLPDENFEESEDLLLAKKQWLHGEVSEVPPMKIL